MQIDKIIEYALGATKFPDFVRFKKSGKAPFPSRPNAPANGQLTESYIVWTPQAEVITGLLRERLGKVRDGHRQFIAHLLATGYDVRGELVPVPVAYRLLRKLDPDELGQDVWLPLARARIIGYTDFSRLSGRSREFYVRHDVLSAFHEAAADSAAAAVGASRSDLVTGRVTQKRHKTKLTVNDNTYPDVIDGALRTLRTGRFYAHAIEAHLADLKRAAATERAAATYQGHAANGRYAGAQARYMSDYRAYQTVLKQQVRPACPDGIYDYDLAYEVQRTGRLTQCGGGLQSASRRMKYAAYAGLPEAHNYDLKACHPNVLLQLVGEAGIDGSWLQQYVDDPNAKRAMAERVGLPVQTWKTALNALINGTPLPIRPSREGPAGAVVLAVREAVLENDNRPNETFEPAYARLRKALLPMKAMVDEWHEHLVGPYLDRHGYPGRGLCIKNAAGMVMRPQEIEHKGARARTMGAFLLQGVETAYIHELTRLSEAYGYQVIANEHDGLVTLGAIPEEAQAQAQERSGFQRAQLVSKALCDWEAQDEVHRLCAAAGVPFPAPATEPSS